MARPHPGWGGVTPAITEKSWGACALNFFLSRIGTFSHAPSDRTDVITHAADGVAGRDSSGGAEEQRDQREFRDDPDTHDLSFS